MSHSGDPAFTALALTFPSEADLAREQGENVDPDALHAARNAMRQTLGRALRAPLTAIFEKRADEGAYAPDAASAGRRALRNVALDLLAAGDATLGTQLAKTHFDAAGNMTDRLAALATLALLGGTSARGVVRALLRAVCRRFARHRQMVLAAGDHSGAGNDAPRARPHGA